MVIFPYIFLMFVVLSQRGVCWILFKFVTIIRYHALLMHVKSYLALCQVGVIMIIFSFLFSNYSKICRKYIKATQHTLLCILMYRIAADRPFSFHLQNIMNNAPNLVHAQNDKLGRPNN